MILTYNIKSNIARQFNQVGGVYLPGIFTRYIYQVYLPGIFTNIYQVICHQVSITSNSGAGRYKL